MKAPPAFVWLILALGVGVCVGTAAGMQRHVSLREAGAILAGCRGGACKVCRSCVQCRHCAKRGGSCSVCTPAAGPATFAHVDVL